MRTDPELTALRESVRLAANRVNAQRSTGPITHEGKAISSLNALRTGLTGRTVLLYSEDVAQYRQHLADYEQEYKPLGLRERELVQSLADTQWRLARIPGLEIAIYAQGRAQNDEYCTEHPETGPSLIELGTFLKYEKQLRNLQLQEARLLRRYEKERKELSVLQAARKQQAEEQEKTKTSQQNGGFEFSASLPQSIPPARPANSSAPQALSPSPITTQATAGAGPSRQTSV